MQCYTEISLITWGNTYMNIKIIDEKDQFAQCETFEITHLLWGTKAIPKTYGKIACWKDHGFLVEMTCEEADPLRTYTKMNDPVSLDSGMEAFLSLWADRTPLYVNVEMNANGATLMQYGTGRADRTFFTEEQIRICQPQAVIEENRWKISFFLPLELLEEIGGTIPQTSGTKIACNFYKVCEGDNAEQIHYASYAPVDVPKPDFHRPEFFSTGILKNNLTQGE